jgi:D-alanine-D-alanine ligase
MGIKVGVFFGGNSVEHEVSVISALQALPLFDRGKYEPFPVYIAKDGAMYIGSAVGEIESYRDISSLIAKSRRVTGVRDGGRFLLTRYPARRFGSSVESAVDVAFPIVHGTNVEDGALQGYFRTMGVPFVGCDVTASAVGMDKYVTKAVLRDNGIPVLDCRRVFSKSFFRDTEGVVRDVAKAVSPFPAIVKPANLGSSVGIKTADNAEELRAALEYAFLYTDNALVERAVRPLREINCAVLGDQESAIASECEEPLGSGAILSYSDKYSAGSKGGGAKSVNGMNAAGRKLPADLSPDARERVRDLARKTFQALQCRGVARIDFLAGPDGQVWVEEVNTIPGSLAFYLWEPVGISYGELLDRLIGLALKKAREEEALTYSFETNILADFRPGALKNSAQKGR